MKKCEACGKSVKNVYTWDGKTYGIECWKKIALPEIERRRLEAEKKRLEEWYEECTVLVEVMRTSQTRSSYKQSVYSSMVEQFETKGYLSKKQFDFAWSLMDNKDTLKVREMCYELGWIDEIDILNSRLLYGTKRQKNEARKIILEKGYDPHIFNVDISEPF